MSQATITEILNRLLAIHRGSFAMYLAQAAPWTRASDAPAAEAVQHLVADQKALIERIGKAILQQGGCPADGEFPMDFTDMHDLSLSYLIGVAIDYQKADIRAIEQCVGALRTAGSACPLAEEALGQAKGHLESLEELVNV
ncbi:MAG: hypothetical protein ACC645_05070 [Pirellulales bacterium]